MKNISIKTGFSQDQDTAKAVKEVIKKIKQKETKLVVFFTSSDYEQGLINQIFKQELPGVPFLGCTVPVDSSTSAMASGLIMGGIYPRGINALSIASEAGKIEAVTKIFTGVGKTNWIQSADKALNEIAAILNMDLKQVDPKKYCGITLFDNAITIGPNAVVGDVIERYSVVAPDLLFTGIGGATAIQGAFPTPGTVHTQDGFFKAGMAIAVIKSEVPFVIEMATNFEQTGKVFHITKMEEGVIKEFDGEPAPEAYAKALGVPVEQLGTQEKPNSLLFLMNPLGYMIQGRAFLRTGLWVEKGKGFATLFPTEPARELYLMKNVEIIEHTQKFLERVKKELNGKISGVIYFACACRLIEARAQKKEKAVTKAMNIAPHIGMHLGPECYGSLLLGYTLTVVAFGE